jgi:adenylate cyclase
MADVDFAGEGLLKGTRGKSREARLDLLQQLHDAGVPLDELKRAVAEDRLALLPVERVLAEEARYTPTEIAELSGVEYDFLAAQQRALGLPVADPDERVFTERDLEAARTVKQFLDAGLPPEGLLEAGRVFGQSMARVAEAVRGIVAEAFAQPGDTERDLGLRQAEVARQLAPTVGPMLEHLYSRHLRDQLRREVIGRTQLMAGFSGMHEVTVCFADLVGFTRLGERVEPDELGSVAERLTGLASDVIEPPVRLVKTIGDATMLVSPEPEPALDSALDLVEAADAEGEDFPQLRAGLAAGEALNRYGDWYGNPVNLASRVTGIAYPGSVLVAEVVRDAVDEDRYAWSFAGEKELKGIKRPVPLFRVRRPDPAEAS